MRARTALLCGMAALLVLVSLVWAWRESRQDIDLGSFFLGGKVEYAKAERYWMEEISREGGETAYAALVASARPLSQAQAHVMAHVFGTALYAREGPEALTVCDDRLSYGCLHQFLGSALSELGLTVLPRLVEECGTSKKPTACAHGIGHGILAHMGYSLSNLKEALAQCEKIIPDSRRNGCTEGVFMEYNLQELTAEDSLADPRPLLPADIYMPCAVIDASYASACGFEQPVWWGAAQATQLTELQLYEWMGKACAGGPGDAFRRGCLQGIGASMGSTVDFPRGVELCTLAAMSTNDRVECLSGLASSRPTGNTPALKKLCASVGLKGEAQEYCMAYVRADEKAREPLAFSPSE